MQATPQDSPPPRAPRRHRLAKWLLAGFVVLGVAIALAPRWIGPIVSKKVRAALGETFGGQSTLGSFSFGWGGQLEVADLALSDSKGESMLRVDSLQASIAPWSALRGRYEVQGELSGFELHLRQDADGSWNWTPKPDSSKAPSPPSESSQSGTLPDVQAHFVWNDGTLVLHGKGGESRFTHLEGKLDWPDRTAPAQLHAQVSVPTAEGGSRPVITLDGTLHVPDDGSVEGLAGNWELSLQDLRSDAWSALQDPGVPGPEGTIQGALELRLEPNSQMHAQGQVHFSGTWPMPQEAAGTAPRNLEQSADLKLNLSLHQENEGWAMEIQELVYASPTAHVDVAGGAWMGDDPEQLQANLTGRIASRLERMQADLEPLLALQDLAVGGALASDFHVQGQAGQLQFTGQLGVTDLHFQAHTGEVGSQPLAVDDPNLQLNWNLKLDRQAQTVQLESVQLQSQVLQGELSGGLHWTTPRPDQSTGETLELRGLRGHFTYIPDRLAELLGPMLPGQLSGQEPRAIDWQFEGRLADVDPLELLQGLQGKATIGLGQYVDQGFTTSGSLDLENQGSSLLAGGHFVTNGGQITLKSNWTLDGVEGETADPSHIQIQVEGMQTNPKVSSMLSLLHPAFQAMDATRAGDLNGLLSAQFDLTYAKPLPKAWLEGDFASTDWSPLSGTGRVQLLEASFANSPLIGDLMSLLGQSPQTPIRLQPIEFTIAAGRLTYAQPWTWTIQGAPTQFEGSIGIDRTLDLTWQVPITEALVQKHSFLKGLVGEAIRLPIGGTVERPKVDVAGTLQGLARKALEKQAKDQLQDAQGKLEDQLKDRIGKQLGGLLGGSENKAGAENPQTLLDQADRLFGEGKQAEAAAIYQRLRNEYSTSLVYLLNKSRIKSRSQP